MSVTSTLYFPAGQGLALLAGGAAIVWIGSWPPIEVPGIGVLRDWQLVFIVVGIPGLIVAALMMTVKEPIRRGLLQVAGAPGAPRSAPEATRSSARRSR